MYVNYVTKSVGGVPETATKSVIDIDIPDMNQIEFKEFKEDDKKWVMMNYTYRKEGWLLLLV